jgi:hypothetical protein
VSVEQMTANQARRALRAELHRQRCADNDHSEARYYADARKLDAELDKLGIEHARTTWARQYEQRQQAAFPVTNATTDPSDNSDIHPQHQNA